MQMAKERVQLNISVEAKIEFDRAREMMSQDPTLGLPSADKAIRYLSKHFRDSHISKN